MLKTFNPSLILWDFNGTLIDDVSVCVDCINILLSRRSLKTMSIDEYRDAFDFPVRGFYERFGFDFQKEDYNAIADEWIECYHRALKGQMRLRDGATMLIDSLTIAGRAQGVLSAYKEDSLRIALDSLGLGGRFDPIIGGGDYHANGKLDAARERLATINVPLRDIVLIGDTVHDYDVAFALGMQAVLISDGHQSENRLRACNCPVFASYDSPELKKFLRLS
ncbi:MAG: HAD hydrolase-like protein [Planctomycetota bacterium]